MGTEFKPGDVVVWVGEASTGATYIVIGNHPNDQNLIAVDYQANLYYVKKSNLKSKPIAFKPGDKVSWNSSTWLFIALDPTNPGKAVIRRGVMPKYVNVAELKEASKYV